MNKNFCVYINTDCNWNRGLIILMLAQMMGFKLELIMLLILMRMAINKHLAIVR